MINSSGDRPIIQIPNEKGPVLLTTAEDIASILTNRLKLNTEKYLGKEIPHTVVSHSVHFDDMQKEAFRDVVTRVGFRGDIRLTQESVSAGRAHKLDKPWLCNGVDECRFLVFDVSERYFTVTIGEVDEGLFDIWEHTRESYTGSHDLGCFDTEFASSPSIDPQKDQCELPGEYESATKTIQRARRVLQKAGFDELGIDAIVVTGINPQAYCVKTALRNAFPWTRATDTSSITPDTAIVHGAALYAHIMSPDDDELCNLRPLDVNRLSIDIETEGGLFTKMMSRCRQLPILRERVSETEISGNRPLQTITVKFYEGWRLLAKENKLLGTVEVQTATKGRVQFKVITEVPEGGLMEARVEEFNGYNDVQTGTFSVQTSSNSVGRVGDEHAEAIYTDARMHYYEDLEILLQRLK